MNFNKTCPDFDIDKKLSSLLKSHVTFKYTKLEKKSYEELLNFTIEMEITNNELLKKIENLKRDLYMYNQTIVDLNLDLDDYKIMNRSLENQLKIKSNFNLKNQNNEINENNENSIYDDNLNYSLTDSSLQDLSIDHDLLKTMKKKKKNDFNLENNFEKLKEDNKNLLNDLEMLVNEIKNLRINLEEKDNIISILYQEVNNLQINNFEEENLNNNNNYSRDRDRDSITLNKINKQEINSIRTLNNSSIIFDNKIHLQNLELIKDSLVNFLKNYGISEDFSKINNNQNNSNNLDHLIEVRMKEIKYILLNLKKLNIVFKSLFMDFSKNLIQTFQTEIENINNNKLRKMGNKLERVSIYLNKFMNNL